MSDTKIIIDLCEAAGIEWRTYIGRGMYGSIPCLGITTDNVIQTILDLVEAAVNSGTDEYDPDSDASDESASEDCRTISMMYQDKDYVCEVISLLQDARTDSMGLSQIVYWPRLKVNSDLLDIEE